MTVEEILRELEKVERGTTANTDTRYVAGLQARALWEIAYQLAVLNEKNAYKGGLPVAHR